jgi:hypothetical protein
MVHNLKRRPVHGLRAFASRKTRGFRSSAVALFNHRRCVVDRGPRSSSCGSLLFSLPG